jgi:hypothetical protein
LNAQVQCVPSADDYIYSPFYSNYDTSVSNCSAPTAGAIPYFNSSYVNPITGTSDWGPFPAAMTGRDAFRGPGSWNLDFGAYKMFFLGERFRLQFRGEMYNLFNHANLYAQTGSNDIGSGFTLMDARRGYNANLAIPTNGSFRTVQLALRLTF